MLHSLFEHEHDDKIGRVRVKSDSDPMRRLPGLQPRPSLFYYAITIGVIS